MFVRLVYESFRRQKRRKLLAGAAIALGVTVATAMIAVATDIGDKINRELRTIGANLVVTPQEDSLDVEIGGVNLEASDRRGIPQRGRPAQNQRNLLAQQHHRVRTHASGKRHRATSRETAGCHAARNLFRKEDFVRDRGVYNRSPKYTPVVEGIGSMAAG